MTRPFRFGVVAPVLTDLPLRALPADPAAAVEELTGR